MIDDHFIANTQLDAVLILSNGHYFLGKGIGSKGRTEGEICFNTGLTGYQETLTDPSYAEQLITFTFPHIGNVGTNAHDNEATRPFCKGVIVREAITSPSNYRSTQSLDHFLNQHQLVGISGIDTRALTQLIRDEGACHALILHATAGESLPIQDLHKSIQHKPDLTGCELTQTVSTKQAYEWTEPTHRLDREQLAPKATHTVVAMDYGIKHQILRLLVDEGFKVIVVPTTASYEDIMSHAPDGVFLSNGPGDPAQTATFTSPVIARLLKEKMPIFGICMGHQLLALAAGMSTVKMHKGHRGTNQPVQDLLNKKVFITSQNHGFAVTEDTLPADIVITFRSLFDGSVEGLGFKETPAFSVQFHPESSPGPHDTRYLFKQFKDVIVSHAKTGVPHAQTH